MMKQQAKASSAAAPKTPNCNFCKGAGEPESVYTAHWQFSKPVDGVLTCPVLLAYKCRLCNLNGHIEKRCPNPAKSVQKPRELFCRFCLNAKKPDYQSHNQFDKNGSVQCPVLLAIECQLCGGKGHTKTHCLSSTTTPTTTKPTTTNPTTTKPTTTKPTTVKKNTYSVLTVIEEEEIALLPEPKETQVAVDEPIIPYVYVPSASWADME